MAKSRELEFARQAQFGMGFYFVRANKTRQMYPWFSGRTRRQTASACPAESTLMASTVPSLHNIDRLSRIGPRQTIRFRSRLDRYTSACHKLAGQHCGGDGWLFIRTRLWQLPHFMSPLPGNVVARSHEARSSSVKLGCSWGGDRSRRQQRRH